MLAIVRRDSLERERLLVEARKQKSGYPWAPEWIALYLNDFESAAAFADAALASPRPQSLRAPVHRSLGLLALAQGRWKAARAEFARAETSIPSVKRLRALSATWPFLVVSEPELVALRTELEQWDPSADPPEPNEGLTATLRPQLRLYLLGLLTSRLGQHQRALEYAEELESTKPTPEAAVLVRDLSRTIRADVALRRGNAADALKLLEPVKGEVPPELITAPFFSQEGSRYLRAEALYQLGRNEDALRWFTHSFEGTPNELAYLAPSHLRRAELYERLGDRKQAVEHYGHFIRLWNSCDPELRPRVTEARARLASLVGERP